MNYEDLLIELGPRGTMGGGGLSDVDPNSWESQEPPESTMLWKYMSFSKFISLLTKKALFFSLVRKMEDKYMLPDEIIRRIKNFAKLSTLCMKY